MLWNGKLGMMLWLLLRLGFKDSTIFCCGYFSNFIIRNKIVDPWYECLGWKKFDMLTWSLKFDWEGRKMEHDFDFWVHLLIYLRIWFNWKHSWVAVLYKEMHLFQELDISLNCISFKFENFEMTFGIKCLFCFSKILHKS